MPSNSAWEATARVLYDLDMHRVEIVFVAVGVLALTLQLVLILWWATGGGQESTMPARPATPSKEEISKTKAELPSNSPEKSDAWDAKDTGDKGLRRRSTYSGGDTDQTDKGQTKARTSASGPGWYFDDLTEYPLKPGEPGIDPSFENTDRMYNEDHDQHRHTAHEDVSMSESSVLDTTSASTPTAQHSDMHDQIASVASVFENVGRTTDAEHTNPWDEAVPTVSDHEPPRDASTSAGKDEGSEISDPDKDEHASHSHHNHGAAEEKLRSMLDI